MSAEVYYFTGTGNSFVVARNIAQKINGKLVSIASTVDEKDLLINAKTIGIIFPVYHATFGYSGIPLIVRKFIGKIKNIKSKYVFAICTHSGMPGATIGNLNKIIKSKGGELSFGLTMKMSIPYTGIDKIRYSLLNTELKADISRDNKERQKLTEILNKKINSVYEQIIANKKGKLETTNIMVQLILIPFYLLQKQTAKSRYKMLSNSTLKSFDKLTLLADTSFKVSEKCSSCGLCVKVCSVKNIKMVENKPMWQHRCENCYACYQWCPNNAIYGKIVEYEKEYHHPDMNVSDMIKPAHNNV